MLIMETFTEYGHDYDSVVDDSELPLDYIRVYPWCCYFCRLKDFIMWCFVVVRGVLLLVL